MTIKDIAKLSGVSVSTVSRVLNNRPDVSEVCRSRVNAVIQSSNYIPNNSARDLVKIRSDAIGLVVRGVSNSFYTDIIRSIEKSIDAAGYTMVMRHIASCDDEVKCGAEMEREKRLRGIVFLGGCHDYTKERIKLLNVGAAVGNRPAERVDVLQLALLVATSSPYERIKIRRIGNANIQEWAQAHCGADIHA